MKKKLLFLLVLFAVLLTALIPAKANESASFDNCAQPDITAAILSLQSEYPEGMTWTNKSPSSAYVWKFPGSIVSMSGCAAFTAILQDSVFGPVSSAAPTWQKINGPCHTKGISESAVPYSWMNLWPGDIVQFNGHTVIVLRKYEDRITVAEGNYAGTVHWGREINKTSLEKTALYVLTRYAKSEPLMQYIDFPEKSHWSREPLAWAFSRGIAKATTEFTVSPTRPCTRADVISYLWAASGSPLVERSNPFTDVFPTDTYYSAVMWALDKGISAGTSETTFTPDSPCTRAEAMTFLWRAAGSPLPAVSEHPFADVAVNDFYNKPVAWAVQYGLTGGTSNTTFSPGWTVTRSEALTFIFRLFAE